jgi:prolyl oligopeptidase
VAVPLTLLTSAGTSGPRPTLLTVYGGFGVSIRPTYQPDALTWVRAGGTLAIAQVRGSGGLGRRWQHDGCRDRKQQAIDDLHAAADWLVAAGRASHRQVVMLGGSNGGLLVTAAIVASPLRYGASAAIAPLTDMVRYERSGLGAAWTAEYGTAEDPEQLRWLLGYSPYHNVRADRRYPPLLLVSGANDTRVDPMHARKLCAMLQDADPHGGPTVLYMVDDAGHGTNPLPQQLDIGAAILSFLAFHSGLTTPHPSTTYPTGSCGFTSGPR